jgi:uncharacterized SAM-binding protein YcdF (DUF218 family)
VAVAAHVLGVQQLLRRPDLTLYLPAAVAGAALGATRLRPLIWISAGILAFLCIAVAYTPLVSSLSKRMIRRDPMPAKVDAIAVLGAGFSSDGMMRSESVDRLLTGLTLARRDLASTLIVSRERSEYQGEVISDSTDQANLLALAKTSAQIVVVDSVFSTRDEALRSKTIAQARGWSTLAVVTSPMHTRRACATFEAVGLKVVCVPADLRDSGLHQGSTAQDRLRAFRAWLYETFASSSYQRRGWIR